MGTLLRSVHGVRVDRRLIPRRRAKQKAMCVNMNELKSCTYLAISQV